MCASCLPSIALPQSLSVFALIAVSLWSARTIIRIGDWYVYGGAFMLDLIRSRIYLGDECLSACPPCDFGFMMRLWNLLPCTSAAEPMRLIARGAITSSILLVKIIVQLCVFLWACLRVCVRSISDGTRHRFLPLKCSNKTNTANWLLPCILMCLFIEVVPVLYMYLRLCKQRNRECKNMNRSFYRMQNLSQIMNSINQVSELQQWQISRSSLYILFSCIKHMYPHSAGSFINYDAVDPEN